MGGSMNSNVVDGICQALISRDIAAFKFNFRGVEGSQGDFDNGRGEQIDALSAVEYISGLPEIEKSRFGLAGYSAGAAWGIAGSCCADVVKAVAAVSPPLALFDFTFLKDCVKPKLLIAGDRDRFIELSAYRRFYGQLMQPIESIVIQGADHFWSGYDSQMADKTADFFARFL
jgi:alpha/beta superfamily hydrolase